MSDLADWNSKIFAEARRRRQTEFDKMLKDMEREKKDDKCKTLSLFDTSADSVTESDTR